LLLYQTWTCVRSIHESGRVRTCGHRANRLLQMSSSSSSSSFIFTFVIEVGYWIQLLLSLFTILNIFQLETTWQADASPSYSVYRRQNHKRYDINVPYSNVRDTSTTTQTTIICARMTSRLQRQAVLCDDKVHLLRISFDLWSDVVLNVGILPTHWQYTHNMCPCMIMYNTASITHTI